MKTKEEKIINDLVYFDNLKIVQNKNYFNFSLDSILLPNFAPITENTKLILDLCTGNAPVPLVLTTKTNAKIIGVELQKEVFELAKESVELNDLSEQIELINDNINNIVTKYETDTFGLITCNPPYFKHSEQSITNDNEIKSIARHEIHMELEDVFKISKKLLKNGGSVCMVHRTDRLMEIIEKMKNNNIEPKRVQFIYPKINSESNLVLVDGRKNGKTGLKVLAPLYVHNEDGSYTDEVLKLFGKC